MSDRSGKFVLLFIPFFALVFAPPGAASSVPTVDVLVELGTTVVEIGPADLAACSATALGSPTSPRRGATEPSSRSGHVDYQPSAAFWSVGGDAFYVTVEGCAGVDVARIRLGAAAFTATVTSIDFESAQFSPWTAPQLGSRLERTQDAALNGGWGLELEATEEATVQPVGIDWDDHGNTNGGSLIVRIEEDDNGGPGAGELLPGTVLWRATDSHGVAIAQLKLESPTDDIVFEAFPGTGAARSCSATLVDGVHDLAVEFWSSGGTSSGRLRIDGLSACELSPGGSLPAVDAHEVGDVTGAGTVGFHLDDLALHDGPMGERRTALSAGYFYAGGSGWDSQPGTLWAPRTDVVANQTWAEIQAGQIFTAELTASTTRWTADFAVDPATLSVSQPVTVLKALDSTDTVVFSLRLRRTINDGDQVRLVEGGTGTTSPWVDLPPGPTALSLQFSSGIDDEDRPSGYARLWLGESVLAEIDQLENSGAVDEVRYGLFSQGSSSGSMLIGPLESWSDEP